LRHIEACFLLRQRLNRRHIHYLCALFLLIAQQGALAHAAWHARVQADEVFAAEYGHNHAHHDGHAHAGGEPADIQASLCAFDLAFGQVLGGAHGGTTTLVTAELPVTPANYNYTPRRGRDAVPEVSRGPPARL
jgi:hypothetical protein